MNSHVEQITLWKRLRKHYIPVLVGLIALSLLASFGVYQAMHAYRATPIAHISPEDSLQTTTLPGKLERYKKELIEQEKQAYRRKVAMDEIVSMDFSQEMKLAGNGKLKNTPQPAKPLENIFEKQNTQKADSIVAQRVKKPLPRKIKKAHWLKGERKTDDGFFIIKTDDTDIKNGGRRGENTLRKL
jgi:hypothetical protein